MTDDGPKTIGADLTLTYITKDEAALILGISPRRVLEYAQSGALASIKMRDPHTNQVATRVHGGDVERLREEREHPKPQPSQTSLKIAREPRGAAKPQAIALIEPPAEKGREESYSWPLPLYLSIGGAVRYTGLADDHIQQAAKEGKIRKIGRKYRRADLDML